MKHTILTFITPVKQDKLDELRALVNEIGKDIPGNRHIPFASFRLLHFASLVLHEDAGYGPLLVFESNFDGPLSAYLDELYDRAAEALHRIYGCCHEYVAENAGDRAQIISFLGDHVIRPNASYVGNAGRSLERIKQESGLRDSLEECCDELVKRGEGGSAPSSLRQKLQAFVHKQPDLGWALQSQPRLTPGERFTPWIKIIVAFLMASLLLLVLFRILGLWLIVGLIAGLIVGLIVLRIKEMRDPVPPNVEDKDHTKQLLEREDRTHIVQNHMASVTLVKPGIFRQVILRTVLWLTSLAAGISTNGTLLGIPSIHFAHWSLIDNGRRLLFLSNFDGSWENYLDDFIDKGSGGLTAIWSNTVGFPRTEFLVLGGARDGARFKAFARDSQRYTNAWYSAYPDLTAKTIDNNSDIRNGLSSSLDDTAMRSWLWHF